MNAANPQRLARPGLATYINCANHYSVSFQSCIMDPNIHKLLTDKLYDKRKNGAFEYEPLTLLSRPA